MMIQTNRVYLRMVQETDFEEMKEYLTNPRTMHFFDHGVLGDEEIKDLLQKTEDIFAIVEKSSEKVIGHFVYHNWFMVDTYEIGWVLNEAYQNQGIISSLAKEVIRHAFEEKKAHRIVATCQPENIASKRICEKSGMRLEGFFQKCIYVERLQEWWDELFFAILEEEYRKKG